MTIGIRHWWFETQYGAALDAAAMENAEYLGRNDTYALGSIEMPYNRIFYLGFRLARGGADYTKYIYGWASLLWNGTDLVLVDSAAETTGAGIYAGTYNAIPVPEPSALGLLLVGAGVLALHRRHARRA
ncbi:MAG: PEP-CTERM sorting domain-containing protein [Kiritimatiellia bacterium]